MLEEIVIRTAALVVAIGGALGVIVKAVRDVWQMANRVRKILDLVEYELQPNDGQSLRDRVDEMWKNQIADEGKLHAHMKGRKEHDALVDEFLRLILDRLRTIDGGPDAEDLFPDDPADIQGP